MKITKQRLKEIIREELDPQLSLPGMETVTACEPASDVDGLSAQVAQIIVDSDLGPNVYGDIIDAAMDKIAEATPEMGPPVEGGEEEEYEPSTRTPGGYGGAGWEPTMGFGRNLREMILDAIKDVLAESSNAHCAKQVSEDLGKKDGLPSAYDDSDLPQWTGAPFSPHVPIDDEVIDFIVQATESGKSSGDIHAELSKRGLTDEQAVEAIAAALESLPGTEVGIDEGCPHEVEGCPDCPPSEEEEPLHLPDPHKQMRHDYPGDPRGLSAAQWIERMRQKHQGRR